MSGPSIDPTVWYRCNDGKLVRNPGDCFENSALGKSNPFDLGPAANGTRTRFLGSHPRIAFDSDVDMIAEETPKPGGLDSRKLLELALGTVAILAILIILAKRRKRT